VTASARSPAVSRRRTGGVASVYRAERRKLLVQPSTRALALVCVLGPLAFAAILNRQSGVPADTLLGVWVHASGYAVSFVVLGFGGYLGFPVLAGVLAGDLFSSEDRYATWKTILARSCSRREVFAGKVLAAATLAVALVALIALSSLLAGLLFTGDQPLVGLGGNVLSSGECLWLVLASWLLSVPPVLAFVSLAVLFSVATRSGIVGVLGPVLVGLAMQLLELIGSGTWVHTVLVASAFDDWHGLLSAPRFYGPTIVGNCVCVVWVVACLGGSWLILHRRDFAGAPVARRPGWVVPAWAVLGCAASIVVLGAATSLGPVAVTQARLEASISSAFNKLTVLQQKELGRRVPQGAKLELRTSCGRHAGKSEGPGDDWTCTMTVLNALPGSEPFLVTPVTYDVSAKSDGCYKADAPPSFVGQQMMTVAHGRSVVNPLYTIYACFDTTGTAVKCAGGMSCAPPTSAGGATTAGSRSRTQASARKAARKALVEAEKAAGPAVMQEVDESEKREKRATEKPVGEAEPNGR
jgi:ABC-2 type transport system permease protein